ncbi:hypothetical protein KIW84_045837 [Lathyrus oleraceus]|uniref:Uncharacterized protein n=1 Tax=Pisum sativum TaxID=3888 RepID=A0A9D4XP62_PEA|nr:hypothetical protein KIW84_045837 [Pisum sativum]
MALAAVLGHLRSMVYSSGGFIPDDQPEEAAAILKEDAEDLNNFIIPGGVCHNWVAVDVPTLYQQRMKKAFDKKVKPRVFREGDLVLKKVLSFAPDSRGKRTPNYEGPYVVKRAFSGGALMLTTMDGEDFTRPVNSDAIFVGVVPQTELLLGLFPSTVASDLLLKTSFSPAAVYPSMGVLLQNFGG